MKLRYILYAGAALMLLASCETRKEQIYYASDVDAVQISAVVGCVHSKSNPLGGGDQLRNFNFNDVICVQTPDLVAQYFKSSTGWEPTDRYYFRWNVDPVTFQAYYPVVGGAGYDKFAVRPNQYSLENLVASDYMTGEAVDVYREKVEIVMNRRMAKLSFKLVGVELGQKVQAFKVGSYSVYEEGQPSGNTTISPYISTPDIAAGEDGTVYTALVIPGPKSSKYAFITMTYKGASLKKTGIPEFEAGYAYDYTVTFNGSSMTLSEPVVSCWTEALASDNQPENPDTPVDPESPVDPEQPEDPQPPVDPEPPVEPEVPTLEGAIFVTPEGAGDKSGKSWENAMGMAELRPMLGSDYSSKTAEDCAALDGLTFHFMEGSYCATSSEKDRLKLDFRAYGKPCYITFLGGYDSSSTGIDLTKRDVAANITKFTGDRNGNGKADDGDTGIFCLDAYAYVTFDGCTFAHAYGKDTWKQKAFMVNTDVEGAATRVDLSNCKFYDNHDCTAAKSQYHGGTAVYLANNATATLHNCQISGSKAKSRGGALRANNATSTFFLNNCSIYENSITDEWGNAVQMSAGNLLMNNCTIAKNAGQGGALNGSGNWVIVNSTIINAHVVDNEARDMTIRCESTANNVAFMVNSIVLFDGEKTGVYVNGEDRKFASMGYNLYNSVAGNGSFVAGSSDKAGASVAGLGLTWNAAGYYTWNGSVADFTKAKLSDIENAVKTGCNKAAGAFTNLGLDFYNWLQNLESGKNPLAYDQAGNARDAAAMWPGAYEKH